MASFSTSPPSVSLTYSITLTLQIPEDQNSPSSPHTLRRHVALVSEDLMLSHRRPVLVSSLRSLLVSRLYHKGMKLTAPALVSSGSRRPIAHSRPDHSSPLFFAIYHYSRLCSSPLLCSLLFAVRGTIELAVAHPSNLLPLFLCCFSSQIYDCSIIVVYYVNLSLFSPTSGGLSGKKGSGQLHFRGRDKPFCAPLKPIPYKELKKLGIPQPPEGRCMPHFQGKNTRNLKKNDELKDKRVGGFWGSLGTILLRNLMVGSKSGDEYRKAVLTG
ncbi:hypothetical protein PIB30_060549 [Stylosanthes scabra]|uniref:Uncharacterized protein n=1 Tax=Stylosanthes scabra TaxID=79078 RepID=A0ABU6RKI5_9FABA|nr:hypothetical protein [Stylosanthes scabra]